jgi:hypothetical protein
MFVMSTEKYVEPSHFSLKSSKEYDEKWLQGKISENPDILGLTSGLSTVSVERKQFNGGRLDLLLENENSETRYTVEVQLGGATDEAHIIRTIEYWDNERSRNPHMEHVAVIILGVLSSVLVNALFVQVAAIVTGVIGLSKSSKMERAGLKDSKKWMAITGVALGALYLARIIILFMVGYYEQ